MLWQSKFFFKLTGFMIVSYLSNKEDKNMIERETISSVDQIPF